MASNISRHELKATTQKSYYKKAFIVSVNNNVETLFSYRMPIIRRESDGSYTRLWNGYSLTTMNHINDFLRQKGDRTLSKKEWTAMEVCTLKKYEEVESYGLPKPKVNGFLKVSEFEMMR